MSRTRQAGFSLIELMITVAIIAMIAIPKFANMIIKAKEAAVKGHIGSVRSALSIYYSDTEGLPLGYCLSVMPNGFHVTDLRLLTPKYINTIPRVSSPRWHTQRPSYGTIDSMDESMITAPLGFTDGVMSCLPPENYSYIYSTNTIKVFLNCSHTDLQGNVWSTY
jgi:general secretion pathway protein G